MGDSELKHPRAVADAEASRVVFARVKGYPAWPAQVLTKDFARAHLGNVAHKSRSDLPVIFFGTSEIAWVGVRDVIPWGEAMGQQLQHKGKKNKKFVIALEQVRDFLTLSGTRRAPAGWWCAPPERGAIPVEETESEEEDEDEFERQQTQLRLAAQAQANAQRHGGAGRHSSGGGSGRGGPRGGSEEDGVGANGGFHYSSGAATGGDEEMGPVGDEDDDSDYDSEEDRGRRRRGGNGHGGGNARGRGGHHYTGGHHQQQQQQPRGGGQRRRSGSGGRRRQEEEEAADGYDEEEYGAEPPSEDVESLRIAAAAIAEMAGGVGAGAPPAPAAAAQPVAAAAAWDYGAAAVAPALASGDGVRRGGSAGAHWLDRYGSDAMDGPSRGIRNSASARSAALQQQAALRAQEEELRQYVAAQAAEAAADAGGWAHTYELDGCDEDGAAVPGYASGDAGDAAGDNMYDEEAELMAAAAAMSVSIFGGVPPPVPPPATTWGCAVALLVPGRRAARTPACVEAAAPLAPFDAVQFALMASVDGAVAAVPGAAAVEEICALPSLQRQQLRTLILRHHRHNERPVVGALASVAAAFPGCCSSMLNAASGRQATVADAATALEAAFGGPCSFSIAFKPAALRRAASLLARSGTAGAAAGAAPIPSVPQPPAAAAAAAFRKPAPPPAHALAEGPAVRFGDPDGPRFELVKRNVYVSRERPKRLPRDEVSVCTCSVKTIRHPDGSEERVGCTETCLNRVMRIHCDPKTCPCGIYCTNKPFHMLEPQAMEIFHTTNHRGHGVRTTRPVPRGSFVVEYAGEVIDGNEMRRRMEAQRVAGQHHFYIMELGPGLFIDALRRGNHARLLNSSCEPNCETQKWYDGATGEMRIGIFALRDISPGEELTYDYMFEHAGVSTLAEGFRCRCGAPKCRGTMDVNPERKRDYLRRVEIYWEGDGAWYPGTVTAYSVTSRKHSVLYDDGETERLHLARVPHRWLDGENAGVLLGPAAATLPGEIPPASAAAAAAAAAVAAQQLRRGGAKHHRPDDSGDSGSWSQTEEDGLGAGPHGALFAIPGAAAAAAGGGAVVVRPTTAKRGRGSPWGAKPIAGGALPPPMSPMSPLAGGGRGSARAAALAAARRRAAAAGRGGGWGYEGEGDDEAWAEEEEDYMEEQEDGGPGDDEHAISALMQLQRTAAAAGAPTARGMAAAAPPRGGLWAAAGGGGASKRLRVGEQPPGGGSSTSTQSGLAGEDPLLAAAMQQLAHAGSSGGSDTTSGRLASLALLAAQEDRHRSAAAAAARARGGRPHNGNGRWHGRNGERLMPIDLLLSGIRSVCRQGPALFVGPNAKPPAPVTAAGDAAAADGGSGGGGPPLFCALTGQLQAAVGGPAAAQLQAALQQQQQQQLLQACLLQQQQAQQPGAAAAAAAAAVLQQQQQQQHLMQAALGMSSGVAAAAASQAQGQPFLSVATQQSPAVRS